MKKGVKDERAVYESNRIYKRCFYILCGGIFVDLIIKFNLYKFEEDILQTVLAFTIEATLLVAVFYINLFALAKKGIAFGFTEAVLDKFPIKLYATLSSIFAFVLSAGMWTPRFCTGSWEYGVFNALLFCSAIYVITFIFAFLIIYISFYFAFGVAKKAQNKI